MAEVNGAIGGYFGLEPSTGVTELPQGVLLNSGRNALRHIVRMLNIQKIHVPYYICPVVVDALKAEKCEIVRYGLTDDMLPDKIFPKHEYVLYVNYFGVCGEKVDFLASQYPNLIVDCAQAYYAKPNGRASFSSPRKFFGVPDGGVAYGVKDADYNTDVSDVRKGHLIERRDNGATPLGYELFRKAETSLDDAEVLEMSKCTKHILRRVDAQSAKRRRLKNFAYLRNNLPTDFPIALSYDDVPMSYPYTTNDYQLRARLINDRIYVPTYWPGVTNSNCLREGILPLPIDQRYCEDDMKYIVSHVI